MGEDAEPAASVIARSILQGMAFEQGADASPLFATYRIPASGTQLPASQTVLPHSASTAQARHAPSAPQTGVAPPHWSFVEQLRQPVVGLQPSLHVIRS